MSSPLRILITKIGLDGHDRGVKIIATALRDAGMEVIYSGLHQTPDAVVQSAVQEDVDCIGISILSGAHMTLLPKLLKLLEENDASDIPVVIGGIIPDEDTLALEELGVAGIFRPGTPTSEIVEFVRELAGKRE
tara:strand:+ start:883 stop:1284 length:402 start_codon:yes stop_codon:yes gene_type:complete